MNGELYVPGPILLQKGRPFATRQETEWATDLGWTLWRRENVLAPTGNGDNSSVFQPIAYSLYQLSYPSSRFFSLPPGSVSCFISDSHQHLFTTKGVFLAMSTLLTLSCAVKSARISEPVLLFLCADSSVFVLRLKACL